MDSAEKYAGNTFKKQGLSPASAGRPPRAGAEGFLGHDTDVNDASGRKIGNVARAGADNLGGGGPVRPSVFSEMVNKYADAVDEKDLRTKYGQ